jgi:heme-degrading monooxygenase HmoA
MYSRVTLFALDTLRFELEAAIERFNEVVLPALLEQPGYEGVYVLVNPDGNGLVLSLWETAEHGPRDSAPGSTRRSWRRS